MIRDRLKSIDHFLFYKINGEWHNSFFDSILTLSREAFLWLPFYFFLVLFIGINYKRKGLFWIAALIITAIVSNYISSNIIKELIIRVRPCNNPMLADHIRVLANYCPQSSSFVSSHATNHFAISTFIYLTLRKPISNWWILIFIWALVICYAQVYVGVHYPSDVICGGMIGCIIGYVSGFIFNKKIEL